MATDMVTYEYLHEVPGYCERPDYSRISPQTIRIGRTGRMVNWQGQQDWRRDTLQPFYEQMTRALHAAGVPILTGTDTGVDGSLPEHIHRELELLVEAGLSPFEALRAATSNGQGEFVPAGGLSRHWPPLTKRGTLIRRLTGR